MNVNFYIILIPALTDPVIVSTSDEVVAENTINKRSPAATGTGVTFAVPNVRVPTANVVRAGAKSTNAVVGLKILLPATAR